MIGEASGKVILFGEHAVVYGCPAIAAALSIGVRVEAARVEASGVILRMPDGARVRPEGEGPLSRALSAALRWAHLPDAAPLRLTLSGALPLGVGLGSSAAFAVALLRALSALPEARPGDLEAGAEALERVFHGNPSGLDHNTILSGGLLRFQAGRHAPLPLGAPLRLAIGWVPRRGQTRDLVMGLRARQARHPAAFAALFEAFTATAEAGAKALENGDLETVRGLFDVNHGLLSACGVSTPEIERLVYAARAAGAGAKLTGAGGGGAVIALGEAPERVLEAWRGLNIDGVIAEVNPDHRPRLS